MSIFEYRVKKRPSDLDTIARNKNTRKRSREEAKGEVVVGEEYETFYYDLTKNVGYYTLPSDYDSRLLLPTPDKSDLKNCRKAEKAIGKIQSRVATSLNFAERYLSKYITKVSKASSSSKLPTFEKDKDINNENQQKQESKSSLEIISSEKDNKGKEISLEENICATDAVVNGNGQKDASSIENDPKEIEQIVDTVEKEGIQKEGEKGKKNDKKKKTKHRNEHDLKEEDKLDECRKILSSLLHEMGYNDLDYLYLYKQCCDYIRKREDENFDLFVEISMIIGKILAHPNVIISPWILIELADIYAINGNYQTSIEIYTKTVGGFASAAEPGGSETPEEEKDMGKAVNAAKFSCAIVFIQIKAYTHAYRIMDSLCYVRSELLPYDIDLDMIQFLCAWLDHMLDKQGVDGAGKVIMGYLEEGFRNWKKRLSRQFKEKEKIQRSKAIANRQEKENNKISLTNVSDRSEIQSDVSTSKPTEIEMQTGVGGMDCIEKKGEINVEEDAKEINLKAGDVTRENEPGAENDSSNALPSSVDVDMDIDVAAEAKVENIVEAKSIENINSNNDREEIIASKIDDSIKTKDKDEKMLVKKKKTEKKKQKQKQKKKPASDFQYLSEYKGLNPEDESGYSWFSNGYVWHHVGKYFYQKTNSFLLANFCFLQAEACGNYSHINYLTMEYCYKQLLEEEMRIVILERGYYNNRISMRIKKRLAELSEKWVKVFENQKIVVIKLQAIARMYIAKLSKADLKAERELEKHHKYLRKRDIKWELRRVWCSYLDRNGQVTMADFFHAWRASRGKIFEMRVQGASRIAALYHGWKGRLIAREIRETDKRLAGYAAIVIREHKTRLLFECMLKIRKIAKYCLKIPAIIKIQCFVRCRIARMERWKRKRAFNLFRKFCFNGVKKIMIDWRKWTDRSIQNKVIVRVQRIVRGKIGRRIARERKNLIIQRQAAIISMVRKCGRGICIRFWYWKGKELEKMDAVTKLQKIIRGFLGRRVAAERRNIVLGVKNMNEEKKKRMKRTVFFTMYIPILTRKRLAAALIIQFNARAYIARQIVKRKKADRDYFIKCERDKLRREAYSIGKLCLRSWKIYAKIIQRKKKTAATEIQRIFRGYKGRKYAIFKRFWDMRSRRLKKRSEEFEMLSLQHGRHVYLREAMQMIKHAYFVSSITKRIQRQYRGRLGRKLFKLMKSRRFIGRRICIKLMKVHDRCAPLYAYLRWKLYMKQWHSAIIIQSCARGFLGRRLAEREKQLRDKQHSMFLKSILAWEMANIIYGFQTWNEVTKMHRAAAFIQKKYRSWIHMMFLLRVQLVADKFTKQTIWNNSIMMVVKKRKAAIQIQKLARAFLARNFFLDYTESAKYKGELVSIVKSKHGNFLIKDIWLIWQKKEKLHRRKVIKVQSLIRRYLAKKTVKSKRERWNYVVESMKDMLHRRAAGLLLIFIKKMESIHVQAMIDKMKIKVLQLEGSQSDKIADSSLVVRKSSTIDFRVKPSKLITDETPETNNDTSKNLQESSNDIAPYLADDGSIPIDLFPQIYINERRRVRKHHILYWRNTIEMQEREKCSLIMQLYRLTDELTDDNEPIGEGSITVPGSLIDDFTSIIFLLHQRKQVIRIDEIVITGGEINFYQVEHFLTALTLVEKLNKLHFLQTILPSKGTPFLADFLMSSKAPDIRCFTVDQCKAHSALFAACSRALKVKMNIEKICFDWNALDTEDGGDEIGNLLCTVPSLKEASFKGCRINDDSIQTFAKQVFRSSSQSRLKRLDLSYNGGGEVSRKNPRGGLTWRGIEPFLSELSVFELSMKESDMSFIEMLDFACCDLTDREAKLFANYLNETKNEKDTFVLNLSDNKITDIGAEALLKAKTKKARVEILLANNNLTVDFYTKLITSQDPEHHTNLTAFDQVEGIADLAVAKNSPWINFYEPPPLKWKAPIPLSPSEARAKAREKAKQKKLEEREKKVGEKKKGNRKYNSEDIKLPPIRPVTK